jgi:hypothetical protein
VEVREEKCPALQRRKARWNFGGFSPRTAGREEGSCRSFMDTRRQGNALKLFGIILKEHGRNIRVKNIIHPTPPV